MSHLKDVALAVVAGMHAKAIAFSSSQVIAAQDSGAGVLVCAWVAGLKGNSQMVVIHTRVAASRIEAALHIDIEPQAVVSVSLHRGDLPR